MGFKAISIKDNVAILAILAVLIMTVLDVTVMNVALPVMEKDFGISDSQTVWIVTVYQMSIVMLLLPVSSFGDLYSYKKTFLAGVLVFTLASMACAFSGKFSFIVISRAVQGIGAACIMGVNIALMRIIYPRETLGRGMALNAMVIAVSTAAGPTLAGAVLTIASWHWLFIINLPLGILAFILGKKFLPQNPERNSVSKFDWISSLENILFFGLLFYSLGMISHGLDVWVCIILMLCATFIGYIYVIRQRGRRDPLLPIDLCKIPLFSLSLCTSVCSFIAQIIAMVALPFLFISYYGFSEVTTGLLMTPWPLSTMLMSPVAARIAERYNPGIVASIGMAIFFVGLVSMALLTLQCTRIEEWDIVWRMVLCGLGFGVYQTPNNLVMVTATPLSRTGGAGGLQSTARLVGQTFGATLVTLIFAFSKGVISVRITLIISACFAALASILSLSRMGRIRASEK